MRLGERRGAGGIVAVETVRVDEAHVGDADEAEHGAEVRLEVVERAARRAGAKIAATRNDHERAFVFREPVEAAGAFGERAAEADDLVDPGFERGGDAEIVDRRGDDELVGGEELVDVAVGNGERFAGRRRVRLGRSEGTLDPRFGHEGRRLAADVAHDDLAVGPLGAPCGEELLAEPAALRTRAARAGVEMEEGGGSGGIHGGFIGTNLVTFKNKFFYYR